MKTGIKVGDIMTRDFVSASPDISIIDCAKLMVKKRVGSLIIQEKGKIQGIITEGDIIYALTKKPRDLHKIKCKELARKKLVTIRPSADLEEAMQKMNQTKYRWLPVLVESKVVGFLTLKDILRIQPDLFESLAEGMQIKEESEKLKRIKESKKGKGFKEGVCNECGEYGILYNVEGSFVCDNCSRL